METHRVLISLASNCDQEENLQQARSCLAQILHSCRFTDAIWTEPYGKQAAGQTGTLYLNQLVSATTSCTVEELEAGLKAMERRLGRTADDRRQGIVRIDLDLLQYDGQRYHLRDWERDYVKSLLPDAGTQNHLS